MTDPFYMLFAALTGVAAALAAIAIRTPRTTPIRAAAVAVVALFIPLAYLSLTEILARPKPMTHEWFQSKAKEATVLGVSMDEGRAIYLWLRVDSSFEPRFYRLPWQQKTAEKLQALVSRAIDEQGVVRILNPFTRDSWKSQGEINIEFVPPPVPPMKSPQPPPQIFNPREQRV